MRTLALAAALLAPLAASGADYVPPPRNVDDILAVLDQYKPDPKVLAKRRATAEREPPAGAAGAELAQFYLERARAHGGLGEKTRQLEDLRKAAELARGTMLGRQRGDNFEQEAGDEGRILVELSLAEQGGGNFLNAVRVREHLLKTLDAQLKPRMGMVFGALAGLTNMNAALGDLAAAHESLRRAEGVFERLQRGRGWEYFGNGWTASMARARSILYTAEGKYAAAEAELRKAVQAMDAGEAENRKQFKAGLRTMPPGQYLAIRNNDQTRLAWVMALQGRLAEAEAAARDALMRKLAFFGRYHPTSVESLSTLSRIIFEQGRFREADLLAAAAVDALEAGGVAPESRVLAEARRVRGATLVALDRFPEAGAVFEKMQAGLATDPEVLRRLGRGDINWAYALVRTGDAARAAAMLRELIATIEPRLGDKDRSVAELHGYLGIALAAQGDRTAALAEFRRAVPLLIEGAHADEASETGGTARWLRLTRVLEAYIDLLAGLAEARAAPPGLDPVAEAFAMADVARGSSVQRALSASAARGAIHDPALAEIARKEQDAQHRIGVLSDLLSRLLAAPREQQLSKIIGDVRHDLEALRVERAQLRAEIAQRFPDYAELIDPKPISLAQAQAALREGEALIAIYAAPAKTYVWAVPQSGAPAFAVAPLGRRELADTVAKLRQALDVGDVPLARIPAFDFKAGYALYAALLKPVEAAWGGAKSLLVAPHGALGYLPFGVLPTAPYELKRDPGALFSANRDAPWLVKRVAITELPSVSTLGTLRRVAPPRPGRREFIGFGDPLFTRAQASAAPAATRGVLRNLSISMRQTALDVGPSDADADAEEKVKAAATVANSAGLAQLAPLPDTSEEITRIAQVLGADASQDVFLRERASETVLKKLDLSSRRIIDFATHGLVPGDLNGLTQPALALSSPEVVGGDDDGLLTMEEIIALKLDADWVVLSACNTGAGEGAGSEALSGLGRAFFFAGARALLVSNWPVETVSARLLTTGLFRRQAENPQLSRAEALRQTMLDLMQNGGSSAPAFSYAHPMFWAPFSLVGDGASR